MGFLAVPLSGGKLGHMTTNGMHDDVNSVMQQSTIDRERVLSLLVGLGVYIRPTNLMFGYNLRVENGQVRLMTIHLISHSSNVY